VEVGRVGSRSKVVEAPDGANRERVGAHSFHARVVLRGREGERAGGREGGRGVSS